MRTRRPRQAVGGADNSLFIRLPVGRSCTKSSAGPSTWPVRSASWLLGAPPGDLHATATATPEPIIRAKSAIGSLRRDARRGPPRLLADLDRAMRGPATPDPDRPGCW